jgi:hypothetical protein
MVKLCALGLLATKYNDEAGYYYNNIDYRTTSKKKNIDYRTTWLLSIYQHKIKESNFLFT